jgi:hypothetical protein
MNGLFCSIQVTFWSISSEQLESWDLNKVKYPNWYNISSNILVHFSQNVGENLQIVESEIGPNMAWNASKWSLTVISNHIWEPCRIKSQCIFEPMWFLLNLYGVSAGTGVKTNISKLHLGDIIIWFWYSYLFVWGMSQV